MSPPAFTVTGPLPALTLANFNALPFVIDMGRFVVAPAKVPAPVIAFDPVSSIFPVPVAVTLTAPVLVIIPLWVMSPAAFTVTGPFPALTLANSSAPPFLIDMGWFVVVPAKVPAPVIAFDPVSSIFPVPVAVTLTAPVLVITPLWVMSPAAFTVTGPLPALTLANSSAPPFLIDMGWFVVVPAKVPAPVIAFDPVSSIFPVPVADTLTAPVLVIIPLCVMSPAAFTVTGPLPALTLANFNAPPFLIDMGWFVVVPAKVPVPVIAFDPVSSIFPVPVAVTLTAPVLVITPVCVMSPAAFTVTGPPALIPPLPTVRPLLFVIPTVPVPVLLAVTVRPPLTAPL
jgi:hypothetical protein